MVHEYDVGTRAWQPDSTEGWVASELVSKNVEGATAKLVFQLENGDVRVSLARLVWLVTLRLASVRLTKSFSARPKPLKCRQRRWCRALIRSYRL